MTTAQSHQLAAETTPCDSGERFLGWLATYRRQLGDPHFGHELLAPGGDQPARLSDLHHSAALHFEEQAAKLSEQAELVDAYEQGAYGSPAIDTVTLSVVPTTVGFSIAVLLIYRNLAVGAVLLVISLLVDAVIVYWWRRPPYSYTGEYRTPSDDAVALARQRASQARLDADLGPPRLPIPKGSVDQSGTSPRSNSAIR
jgi:hypothetical protein